MAAVRAFESVNEVHISQSGVFKYVALRVVGPSKSPPRDLVRGCTSAEYHADIVESTEKELQDVGLGELTCECLGGGRIRHDPDSKTLHVYGYSMGFGRADHVETVEKLQKHYPGYTVTWSNEGY
uniref:14 kDa phosphohistidine phosphatase n=1 Tax=Myxine glutinosa TaxID=7769 RepID=UPI00358E48FD